MKKAIALLLCLVSIVSLFAGCGGGETQDPQAGGQQNNGGDSKTITIGLAKSPSVVDYYENYYTQWLEEKSGYDIEFKFFGANPNDYRTQVNTIVAGQLELPDILWCMQLGESMYERLGQDGVLVDVSDYFEDETKSAVFRERLGLLTEEVQQNTWNRMYASDGSGAIYVFPEVQESLFDIMDYQVWINQEWLDTLGLPMPTDMDSLYTTLKAFKEKDPNGNGLADEIPLIGASNGLSGDVVSWLVNMFLYCDDKTDKCFNVDENGNLYVPQMTDEYREALKFVRKLYAEGLLNPLSMSASAKDLNQLLCPSNGGAQLAGIAVGHITSCFIQGHEGLLNYEALPLWGNAVFNENLYSMSTFITKDCENVDAAWELLMLMYSEESAVIQRYGKEGEQWDWAEEGSKSVIGDHREAQIRLYQDIWGTQSSSCWHQIGCTILLNAEGEGNQSVPENETELNLHKYRLVNELLDSYYNQQENYNPPAEQICPLIIWPEEYQEQLPTQRSDCPSVITKYRSDFIAGTLDINKDADWNTYLNKLKDVGVEDWLYYAQLVYNDMISG